MSQESDAPLPFLTAAMAEEYHDGSCVVIVRTREEFVRWLREPKPGVEWLQVEGLLGDQEVWATAAQGTSALPLDVILIDPATEFSLLYRLVDARIVRSVRVTMPAAPGFMKALRLAASLQLPVRLLPGQPTVKVLAELTEAVKFYLHDPMVDSPVEFFHSLLISLREDDGGTLWRILEEDPNVFARENGQRPRDFVEQHLASLIERGAECASCRWQTLCAGYFKSPDPQYDCAGVKQLLALIESAAEEMNRDLAGHKTASLS
ncbi:MAG: hypothetical protein K8R87_05035 [Verrucomicrobia bacterium]|nr:hypothetical protein [Verrucomicrobiota bacterium]